MICYAAYWFSPLSVSSGKELNISQQRFGSLLYATLAHDHAEFVAVFSPSDTDHHNHA